MTPLAGTLPYSLVVVEDNASDVFLLQRALAREQINYRLTHLLNGAAGLAFVHQEAPHTNSPCPDLILVDWSLPKSEILIREVRKARHLDGVLACGWSSLEILCDRKSLKRLGIDQFILKPSGLEHFMHIGKIVKDLLSGIVEATRIKREDSLGQQVRYS